MKANDVKIKLISFYFCFLTIHTIDCEKQLHAAKEGQQVCVSVCVCVCVCTCVRVVGEKLDMCGTGEVK